MLELNPTAKKIRTSFSNINEEVFNHSLSAGNSPLEAIMSTPAYKIRVEYYFP